MKTLIKPFRQPGRPLMSYKRGIMRCCGYLKVRYKPGLGGQNQMKNLLTGIQVPEITDSLFILNAKPYYRQHKISPHLLEPGS